MVGFSARYLSLWLAVVSMILLPLEVMSLAIGPEEQARLWADSSTAVTIGVLLAVSAIGVAICLSAMYRFWWHDKGRSFGERVFWAVALLNVPSGMILYYFLVFSRANRSAPRAHSKSPISDE